MNTHDEIRTALITTLQADAILDAAIETWLKYLIDTGQITYPALYVGTITQPFDGPCGTNQQYTTIINPMEITVGVLSDTHKDSAATLGTLYKKVYDVLQADPTIGLPNPFQLRGAKNITTKPLPKCGRAIIRAEITMNATEG